MTKEELKKEAEEYSLKQWEGNLPWSVIQKSYYDGALPREKRIAELEAQIEELKADNDARKFAMAMSEKVEKQLREENTLLKRRCKMEIFRNPVFEMKINKAWFLNQEIVVFPQGVMPKELGKAVRFLFGEGAIATQDCVNTCGCIRITGANYVLNNVKTLNADWEYKEVKGV